MNDNPDNPMAAPLTRAEEIRLWGDESAAAAAEQRTRYVIADHDDPVTELDVGAADDGERELLGLALQFAASGRDDAVIAAAVKQLLQAVLTRCDASYWDIVDERALRMAQWRQDNDIARRAAGLPVGRAA